MRRAVPLVCVVLLAAPAALAGCGTDPQPVHWLAPSPPAAPSPTPTGPPEITLAFAGDIHFVERTLPLLEDPATAFGPVATVLSDADLAMVNLETAVTDGGTPEPKEFLFRAPPATWDAVREAGVDVVTLANNHALDYGRDGLADTLGSAAAADVPVVGAGESAAAAYAPWIAEVAGVRIAFLGLSQVWELWESWSAQDDRAGIAYAMDTERALAAVAAARSRADVVVVYVHWGQEGNGCPIGEMTSFAEAVAAAGADIVVGTHAHLLLGDGWLGRTYVQYGLGNFLWWRDDRFSNDTGVLWVTLEGPDIVSVELRPAVISRETGQPIPVAGREADRVASQYEDLRACTGLAASRS